MSKSAPAPPDYTGAANAQAGASKDITNMQTWANRPNINTPFGSQSWDSTAKVDPATGRKVTSWTQNNKLTPEMQQALDAQQRITAQKSGIAEGLMGQTAGQLNTPIDYNSATPLKASPDAPDSVNGPTPMGSVGSPGAFYNKAGDAVMSQFNRYQAPQLKQQQDAMRAQLYGQGLHEGDQAYDQAMGNLNNQQDQARQGAMDSATQMSANVGNQMFGQALSDNQNQWGQSTGAANFQSGQNAQHFGQQQSAIQQNNQVHQQQIADMMQKQGFGLNEINAILNGQQVAMPNMPNFSQASKSETPQLLQAANDQFGAQMSQFGANQAGTQGLMNGAMQGAMMFSDRRLKADIRKIGSIRNLSIYLWTYIWGEPGVGVMADEVAHIPGAVIRHSSGYDLVNYGVLNG